MKRTYTEIALMLLVALVFYTIFGLIFDSFNEAKADDGIFKLDEVSLTYRDYFDHGSDPLITQNGIPNRTLGKELSFSLNVNIGDIFYWENRVHGATDEEIGTGKGQFRVVGLEERFGLKISNNLEFGLYHHSQHLLDSEYQYGHWPVSDALELKIYFIPNKKGTLF